MPTRSHSASSWRVYRKPWSAVMTTRAAGTSEQMRLASEHSSSTVSAQASNTSCSVASFSPVLSILLWYRYTSPASFSNALRSALESSRYSCARSARALGMAFCSTACRCAVETVGMPSAITAPVSQSS